VCAFVCAFAYTGVNWLHHPLYFHGWSCNIDDYRVKKLKELNFGESNALPNGGWTPTTNPEDFVQVDREITGKDVLVVCGRRIGKSRRGGKSCLAPI